ncbi:MAG: hypothetical protein P8Z80_00460 [Pseudolabrys sp.]
MTKRHPPFPSQAPVPTSKVAERLRAHARLCQHIAEESWNEAIAGELGRLAEQCVAAADNIDANATPGAQVH